MLLSHVDAQALDVSFFGAGSGPIFMDDISCLGTEARLVDCIHTTQHNCFHYEDASVICNHGMLSVKFTNVCK